MYSLKLLYTVIIVIIMYWFSFWRLETVRILVTSQLSPSRVYLTGRNLSTPYWVDEIDKEAYLMFVYCRLVVKKTTVLYEAACSN